MNRSVLLLLLVTLVWGTTFPLLKSASADLNGVEISALRFLVAAVCMLPFLARAPRAAWTDGMLLGALALASYVAQAYGLQHISSNRSAFLTSLNVLMVPFLGLLFGGRLSAPVLLAAVLACLGIGLMSWEGGGNPHGDAATLLCALAYALYVIVLSRRSPRHQSAHLAATQIAVMAILATLWVLLQSLNTDTLASLPARAAPHATTILYLGACATAAMLFLQAIGQRKVPADKAAVIYSMEPVFASLFGWMWLGEVLGVRGLAGGAIVIGALLLSELRPRSQEISSGRP
ncbi:MAG TPA: DMT family transporter [Noviherbaspirillum sp.]|uniref:DMT family transporter n=1 Tax=Noviherbaspirillum sp. TaxID=1926288 RepID=UPI002DDCF823|nr:DMT family transporter [Noviherbaspirillum sp.]HEV2611503.1 DMT family transporter [Noviherbaspirillum sp.]